MRRRPAPQPGTPLNQKQEELTQRESQLRGEMEKLERMIAEAPRVAEETTRRRREELLARAGQQFFPLPPRRFLRHSRRFRDHPLEFFHLAA